MVMSSLTASKKDDEGLFSFFFFTFAMERSLVLVSCGGIAVFSKLVFG